MKDYWVVFQFNSDKALAKQGLTRIKKVFENAVIEEEDSYYIVTIGHFTTEKAAKKAVSKAVEAGLWGGIYKVN